MDESIELAGVGSQPARAADVDRELELAEGVSLEDSRQTSAGMCLFCLPFTYCRQTSHVSWLFVYLFIYLSICYIAFHDMYTTCHQMPGPLHPEHGLARWHRGRLCST